MTGRTRKAASDEPDTRTMEFQRIRVRRDGYDASGTYWGTGPDVFIATLNDGAQEITVRAKSVTDARVKIAAEVARAPGAQRGEPREPLGGASPNKSRYEIDWRDAASSTTVRIRITHSRDYLGMGQDHIEVASIAPKKAALPITETGYRSHFLSPLELINAGGAVTFVTAWLDRETKSKDWQKRQAIRSQGDLFSWADTQTEIGQRDVTKRKRSPKPKPDMRPAKSRKPASDPG